MANAARTDIGRQEVLAKSEVVLGRDWQAKALAENYLIEICRILPKRISVRVEHVKHSQCRKDFLDRVHSNEVKKKEAKETGKPVVCKRFATQPKPAHIVSTKDNEPQQLGPIPYEFIA